MLEWWYIGKLQWARIKNVAVWPVDDQVRVPLGTWHNVVANTDAFCLSYNAKPSCTCMKNGAATTARKKSSK